ncbi:MAG TPA: hypothetical protein VFE05_03865 [Longimicrobiaceae bacterium]|jgi:hypothetical protein|nr:hypothetical protein [Longimicrobiaceae bacterium]
MRSSVLVIAPFAVLAAAAPLAAQAAIPVTPAAPTVGGVVVSTAALPAAPAGMHYVTLPEGTEFEATLEQALSSRTATEGDAVSLRVKDDVVLDGRTVVRSGAPVRGEVTQAQRSGRMGRGGQLNIRIQTTSAVDGQRVALRSARGKEGDDKVGSTVALTVLFGPIGLLKRGHDATIPAGTAIKVYTDAPVNFLFQDAPAAAAAAVPAAPVAAAPVPAPVPPAN